jgi:short-subunit dehydrogenase
MRVLVTGAFGNIGSNTVALLLRRGHAVRCFDVPTKPNIRSARRLAERAEVVWGDLRSKEDVARAVREADVVVHLGFIIPRLSATGIESEAMPDLAREVNVGGTRNLIEAMQACPRPPRLIFTSSLHVYGKTQGLRPPRRVTDPPQPVEHYAHHKVECEALVRASGLKWAIFRLGAALPIRLVLDPGMFDVPLRNRIEYVHTKDVALAIANALERKEVWGRVWHVGGGPRCQLYYGDIVGRVLEATGIGRLPEEAFATVSYSTDWLDTTRSQRLLRFQEHSLDDYVSELKKLLGFRRPFVRMLRPFLRPWLLSRSPALRATRLDRRTPDWRGRVAVITGASSGIGAITARRLAREGMKVVLVARRADRLQRLAESIRTQGGDAVALAADLADEKERLRLVARIHKSAGPVDVLINNAGFGWYGFGTDMPWSTAWQMMQVNMAAMAHLTLLLLPEMKRRRRGHIINVGSIVGSFPSQGVALYSATKSFVDTFTTALYRELRDTGVHITVVRPGAVAETAFYDLASTQPGLRLPAERLAISPQLIAERIWGVIQRPRRVVHVPRALWLVPWAELAFGWLIDRIGPLLLRRSLSYARQPPLPQ